MLHLDYKNATNCYSLVNIFDRNRRAQCHCAFGGCSGRSMNRTIAGARSLLFLPHSEWPDHFTMGPYLDHVASKRGRGLKIFLNLLRHSSKSGFVKGKGGGQNSKKMATWFVYGPLPCIRLPNPWISVHNCITAVYSLLMYVKH